MKMKGTHGQAVALIGLSWMLVSGAAYAEDSTARQHAEMREACAERGGRFEQSWLYNDQGTRWGETLSCSTSKGYVKCQGNVCRSGRWGRPDNVASTDGAGEHNDSATQFPAEPVAIADALAMLAGQ